MDNKSGVIDLAHNPFARPSWIKQGYGITGKRQEKLKALFGKRVQEIMSGKDNDCRYPAFVGVRWGFAQVQNDVLKPTGKWENRHLCDEYGGGVSSSVVSTPSQIKSVIVPVAKVIKPERNMQRTEEISKTDMDISWLSKEIERRRRILVELAHRHDVPMEPVEREHIIQYLEKKQYPEKPYTEIVLMKEFVSSALSINQPPHRIRNKMKHILGDIPLADTIPLCLQKLYNYSAFMDDNNWTPDRFAVLLSEMPVDRSDSLKSDIRTTLLALAKTMGQALEQGIDNFYNEVDAAIEPGPAYTWRYMERFTSSISGVGPWLMSDFLKNVGFPQFVKIDQRLKKEFPKLIEGLPTDQKSMFIYAIKLCQQLNMTPFLFDHILYQWGNKVIRLRLKYH